MLNITNLSEKQKDGTTILNMIVYGSSGAGKTTFASTAADLGRVLYVDSEAGAQYIDGKRAENIDMLELKNIEELEEIFKEENIEGYQTIVLDSITEIMKKMVDYVKGSKETATLQDWGKIITKMETFFRRIRDLEKNTILVALETEKEDENTILKRPSLSGKNLPTDIIGFQDICMYIENTTQGRVGHVQPSNKFYAKDRTNKLPYKIEQQDLNVSFILESILTEPEPITDKQKEHIEQGMKDLGLNEDQAKAMFNYGGGTNFDDLTFRGAEKIIQAIDKKLANQK